LIIRYFSGGIDTKLNRLNGRFHVFRLYELVPLAFSNFEYPFDMFRHQIRVIFHRRNNACIRWIAAFARFSISCCSAFAGDLLLDRQWDKQIQGVAKDSQAVKAILRILQLPFQHDSLVALDNLANHIGLAPELP